MIAELIKPDYLVRPNYTFMASKTSELLRDILNDPHFTKTAFALDLYPGEKGKDAAARLTPKLSEAVTNRNLTEQEEAVLVSQLQTIALKILGTFPLDQTEQVQPKDEQPTGLSLSERVKRANQKGGEQG